MGKAKTHEEFVQEVTDKFPWIKVLGFYINNHTKIEIEDTRCGHKWKVTPNSLLSRKSKCPTCSKKNVIKIFSKSRLRKLEDVLTEIEEKYPNLFEYIGGYVNTNKKCWWKCKICGHVWKARPSDILSGRGCPECKKEKISLKQRMPLEKVIQRVYEIWNDLIEYVEGYKGVMKKCKWKCTKCGNIWEASPDNIFHKHGCPICAKEKSREKRSLPLQEFLKRLKKIWGNDIIYIEGYKCLSKKCWFMCKNGHKFEAIPTNLLAGKGCALCLKNSLEEPIINILNKIGVIYKHDFQLKGSNYNKSRCPLRIDFMIETEKGTICFELDGKQHFYPLHGEKQFKKQIERDKHKDNYCKEKGYLLIRATSSPTKEWGTDRHVTLPELFNLIELAKIPEKHTLNFDIFKPHDFNKE